MEAEKQTIIITLIYAGIDHRVQTSTNHYHSLMTLVSDHLAIPGFGLCCGMGSCGSCRVEISDADGSYTRSALSCEVRVDDYLAGSIINVLLPVY